MTDVLDLIDGPDPDAEDRRIAKALLRARHDVEERTGGFLRNASTQDEWEARARFAEDVITEVANVYVGGNSEALRLALLEDWAKETGVALAKGKDKAEVVDFGDAKLICPDDDDDGERDEDEDCFVAEDEEDEKRKKSAAEGDLPAVDGSCPECRSSELVEEGAEEALCVDCGWHGPREVTQHATAAVYAYPGPVDPEETTHAVRPIRPLDEMDVDSAVEYLAGWVAANAASDGTTWSFVAIGAREQYEAAIEHLIDRTGAPAGTLWDEISRTATLVRGAEGDSMPHIVLEEEDDERQQAAGPDYGMYTPEGNAAVHGAVEQTRALIEGGIDAQTAVDELNHAIGGLDHDEKEDTVVREAIFDALHDQFMEAYGKSPWATGPGYRGSHRNDDDEILTPKGRRFI